MFCIVSKKKKIISETDNENEFMRRLNDSF